MAVNSHYIPQFLLRGFACREDGNERYVYVFRSGARSYEANTKNVASQRNFYGDPHIEKVLSEWEGRFGELVRRLRDGTCGSTDKPLIDRFVTHTLVRTRFFRDGVHAIGATVMENVFREFLVPERTPLLLHKLENDIMNEPQVKELLSRASLEERPYLEILMRQMLRQPGMHDLLRAMIAKTLPEIDTAASVQTAQRQVLEDGKNLDRRIRDLNQMTWSVELFPSNSFVLGDIGPLVRGDNSPEWGVIFLGTPQEVRFPLSHNCLLRGQVGGSTESVDSQAVNILSVGNSVEFFVASQRTNREAEYQKLLASRVNRPPEVNLDDMQAVIREYLESPGGSLTTEE